MYRSAGTRVARRLAGLHQVKVELVTGRTAQGSGAVTLIGGARRAYKATVWQPSRQQVRQAHSPANTTASSAGMDGQCNCGAVKVHVEDSEMYSKRRGHICYCANCQKTAGSSKFGLFILAHSEFFTTKTAMTMLRLPSSIRSQSHHREFRCHHHRRGQLNLIRRWRVSLRQHCQTLLLQNMWQPCEE